MNFKNITITLICLAIFGYGCTKSNPATSVISDVEISFNIGEKGGFDTSTKALRTGWEAGDQILVVFKKSNNSPVSATLTFDGTDWSSTALTMDQMMEIGNTGSYFAVHHKASAGNGIKLNNAGISSTYEYGIVLECKGTYEYKSGAMNLGDINMTKSSFCEMQFSVAGLPEGEWYMEVRDYNGNFNVLRGVNGFGIYTDLSSSYIHSSSFYDVSQGDLIDGEYVFVFKDYKYKVGDEWENDESDRFAMTQDDLSFYIFMLRDAERAGNATKQYYYMWGRGLYNDGAFQKNLAPEKAYKFPAITNSMWYGGYPNWFN